MLSGTLKKLIFVFLVLMGTCSVSFSFESPLHLKLGDVVVVSPSDDFCNLSPSHTYYIDHLNGRPSFYADSFTSGPYNMYGLSFVAKIYNSACSIQVDEPIYFYPDSSNSALMHAWYSESFFIAVPFEQCPVNAANKKPDLLYSSLIGLFCALIFAVTWKG